MVGDFKHTDILQRGAVLDYISGQLIGVQQYPLSTRLPMWDQACDGTGGRGLDGWWYNIIGGASNAGKTQLLRWLMRQAAEQGYNPALVTMEVPTEGLQRHYYSNLTTFGYYDLLPHRFDEGPEDIVRQRIERLTREITEYAQPPEGQQRAIRVVESDGRPQIPAVLQVVDALIEAGHTHIGVDHAQLIKAPRGMEIAEAAAELSEELRIRAHRNRCCIILLSQLNRTASSQRDRKPTMHDLWGGTAMESNCNQVVLLDHSRDERPEPHLLRTWLLLDKNREGPAKVEIPVEINFRSGVWREAMPDEYDRWP